MTQPEIHTQPSDPLIDEIREIRARLDGQFGDDWEAYVKFINERGARIQQEFGLTDAAMTDIPGKKS